MDLSAVGCCTRGLISVLHVPLTVRSGRKCSLLQLHALQPSAKCREKSFICLFHSCVIDSINPIQDIKSLLSRLYYIDLPKCQDKKLPASLRMSLTFNIPLFIKDKLKIGLPCLTIKLLYNRLFRWLLITDLTP